MRRVFEVVKQCCNMKHFSLSQNVIMPIVGLGTWNAKPEEIEQIIEIAIGAGYRHIDTAFNYNNEAAIGNALKRLISADHIKRRELFITTKLPVFGNRARDVERFLKMSLSKLQMDYVDLYLIHMPFAFKCDEKTLQPALNEDGSVCLDFETNLLDTWKAMEEQVNAGFVKAIGLSNFNLRQVKEIYANANIKPAVLQVELHAYNQQKDLVEGCRNMNIIITAYAPLGSPNAQKHFLDKYNFKQSVPKLLEDSVVNAIATELNRSPGQILLKHLIQKKISVIPKSVKPERIHSNINLFDFQLSDEHMAKLDTLDLGEEGRIFDFTFFKGVKKHPQYPFAQSLPTI